MIQISWISFKFAGSFNRRFKDICDGNKIVKVFQLTSQWKLRILLKMSTEVETKIFPLNHLPSPARLCETDWLTLTCCLVSHSSVLTSWGPPTQKLECPLLANAIFLVVLKMHVCIFNLLEKKHCCVFYTDQTAVEERGLCFQNFN